MAASVKKTVFNQYLIHICNTTAILSFTGEGTVILNKAIFCIVTFFGHHFVYYIISERGAVTLGSPVPLYRQFFPPLPLADISRETLFPVHNYTYHFH